MKNWLARKQGKAHTAAVKGARLPEIVEGEYKQTLLMLGEFEFQRRMCDEQILTLMRRAQTLHHEIGLAREKAEQDKTEAERLAAQETSNGEG